MNLFRSLKLPKSLANKVVYASLLAMLGLGLQTPYTYADDCSHRGHHYDEALELGLSLETQFWTLVQKQNVPKFTKKFAAVFQGINTSGPYTLEQQIESLTGASLSGFFIYNPIATRCEDILVFSYDFIAADSDLTSGPSITVWKKYNHSWKIVSHTYLPFNN